MENSSSVRVPSRPDNEVASFHTHPNQPANPIQWQSSPDITVAKKINDINYVIGWNEMYKKDPNTQPFYRDYVHIMERTFTHSFALICLLSTIITLIPIRSMGIISVNKKVFLGILSLMFLSSNCDEKYLECSNCYDRDSVLKEATKMAEERLIIVTSLL